MEPATVLYGVAAVFAGACLLALLYGRRASPTEPGTTPASPRTSDDEDDADDLRCPHCGTANAAEYRFCRRCVADLRSPARGGLGTGDPPP